MVDPGVFERFARAVSMGFLLGTELQSRSKYVDRMIDLWFLWLSTITSRMIIYDYG